jgi:uncharacterized RDD family membrane protein YckC
VTGEVISPLPREARAYQGRPAGVVTRVVAAVIDALVVAGLMVLGYAVVTALRLMADPLRFTFPDPSWLLSITTAFVLLVIYLGAGWAVTGRSYGGHVMGIRVLGRRKKRMRPVGALVRALACAVFPIGLLWCAVSPANRSVQDVVLRTRVVYDWQPYGAADRRG